MDAPDVNEQKILNYIVKRKLIKDAEIGYETFKAQDTDDNSMVTLKMYLKNEPKTDLPSIFEQYYWTYKDGL